MDNNNQTLIEKRREEFDDLISIEMFENENWYLIPKEWRTLFFTQDNPPPVDTTSLLIPGTADVVAGVLLLFRSYLYLIFHQGLNEVKILLLFLKNYGRN